MKPPPKTILAIVGLVSAFIIISGAIGLWQSIDAQAWFRIGFESVLTLSGVIGLLTALGRFNSSPAWSMISITGAILVCTLLANATSGHGAGMGMNPVALFRSALKDQMSLARLVSGGVMGIMFVLTLFVRAPGVTLGRLLRGGACLAPVVATVVLWRMGPLKTWVYSLNVIVQTGLAIVAFFASLILISAGVHYLIRSLEAGAEATEKSTGAANEKPKAPKREPHRAKDDRPIAQS